MSGMRALSLLSTSVSSPKSASDPRYSIMIDLLDLAEDANWESGRLAGAHSMANSHDLPFPGDDDDDRGFVRVDSVTMEDGKNARALRTHPKWVENGTIKGWFPRRELPDDAVFHAEYGFLKGAEHTNGAEFQVWAHYRQNGEKKLVRIARQSKGYTGSRRFFDADLTHLSGKRVGIELRVDTEGPSTQDWAAWVNPRVESDSSTGSMPVTINLNRFRALNIDEDSATSDIFGNPGDEPYLIVLGYKVDNQTLPEAHVFSAPDTHGNLGKSGVEAGDSFTIPGRTGKFEKTMYPVAPGLLSVQQAKEMAQIGIVVIAAEHDSTDTSSIDKGRRKMVSVARKEISKLVEERLESLGSNGSGNLDKQVQKARKKISEKASDVIVESTLKGFDVFGAIDPDNIVDSKHFSWSYKQIQEAGLSGIPFTIDARDKENGVRYQIDGKTRNM